LLQQLGTLWQRAAQSAQPTAEVVVKFTAAAAVFAVALASPAHADPSVLQTYQVKVVNVSQQLVNGQPWRLSPVVWLVHRQDAPLFSPGELDRGLGLRRLAEAGQPKQLALICSSIPGVQSCGSVEVPDGASQPGGLRPGNSFSFAIQAAAGDRLSLVGMVVPSHDTIWATPVGGVLLSGQASQPTITLWDAGTEVNEAPPGLSSNQPPLQAYPDQGLRAHNPVTPTSQVAFGKSYPASTALVQVSITP
jgi:hypothetical protein